MRASAPPDEEPHPADTKMKRSDDRMIANVPADVKSQSARRPNAIPMFIFILLG
jgi:hypothetical protein